MASTRSARITSTSGPSFQVRERSGQHVTVGRYSGDGLRGKHANHHRTRQTVGRGSTDNGGQLELRGHGGRGVGRRGDLDGTRGKREYGVTVQRRVSGSHRVRQRG